MTASAPALRADARRNRERILLAAAEMFGECGVDVQIVDIAARAGVGTGTLYRHFSTKDELIYAVVNTWFEDLFAVVETCASIPDAATAFRSFFAELCACAAEAAPLARALHTPLTTMPRPVPAERRVVEVMGDVLRRAQREGVVRADIVAEDLPPLLAVVENAARDDLYAHRQWQRYMTILFDGISSPLASPLEPRVQ